MDFEIGQIVFSKAGRDKGIPLIIVRLEIERNGKEEYAYLVDGKYRLLANPKKKKTKHLQITKYTDLDLKETIAKKQHLKDSDFKDAIRKFNAREVSHG